MLLADVAGEKYLYLTTRGRRTGRAHTVEVWFAVAGEKIYLSHEGQSTDWMKNIVKDGRVEFKIGRVTAQGTARIVKDAGTFERGKDALYLKYYGNASREVIDDWFSESTVVEIAV